MLFCISGPIKIDCSTDVVVWILYAGANGMAQITRVDQFFASSSGPAEAIITCTAVFLLWAMGDGLWALLCPAHPDFLHYCTNRVKGLTALDTLSLLSPSCS
jgi:hypothetical protein